MAVGNLKRYGLPFANVVAMGIATCEITPGRTLENLRLKLDGGVFGVSNILLIKIKANGRVIVEITGSELYKLNMYRGADGGAGFLDVPFYDQTMLGEFDRAVGSLDTINLNSITAEVTIDGATDPQLTAILTESISQKSVPEKLPFSGLVSKILRYPYSVATGGKLPVTVPFGAQNGAIIKRFHVFHGGAMSGATVKQDGLVIHESRNTENEFDQKSNDRVPQSGVYTLDFVVDGSVRKALNTTDARSLEWLLDFDAADNGYILVEYLDRIENL